MGLRSASVRHPNVVVMAPALTETAEPLKKQNSSKLTYNNKFRVYSRNGRLSFADAKPRLSNSIGLDRAMNGHSPSKTTHSLNGLVKSAVKGFVSLNKSIETSKETDNNRGKCENGNGPQQSSTDYILTPPIGGYIMNDTNNPLEEDNMGLQKENEGISTLPDMEGVTPSKEKITQGEVDQLFKNLGVDIPDEISAGGDLAHNVDDLFRDSTFFNNIDSNAGSDNALGSTPSDGDVIFPSGLTSLFSDDVMMNMCVDENLVNLNKESIIKEKLDEALKKQFQLKRKCDFLMRRLRKLQSRTLGKHVCEEVTGILEYTSNLFDAFNRSKTVSNEEPSTSQLNCEVKSVSLSTLSLLMRQMEHSSAQQASYIAKNCNRQKYFGAGPSSSNITSNGMRIPGTIIPTFKPEIKKEISRVTGELSSQLSLLESEIDSDLTASSSGCDSCDESLSYNNVHQQQVPIRKRAIWRWNVERATLASRWTWLQAKMADLEYKIRQTNEMRRQLRQAKGVIRLAAKQCSQQSSHHNDNIAASPSQPINGLMDESTGGCARTVGVAGWRKRKLVRIEGLHLVSKRALKQSTVKCSCRGDRPPCLICTGRVDPTSPSHTIDMQPIHQRLAFFDMAYHPQLSFPSDVSQSCHYNALMKHGEWQMRAGRVVCGRGRLPRHATDPCIIGPNTAKEAASAVQLSTSITPGRKDSLPSNLEPVEPKRCKVLTPTTQSPGPSPHVSDLPTIAATLPPIVKKGYKKKNTKSGKKKIPLDKTNKVKKVKKQQPFLADMDSNSGGSSRSCPIGSVQGTSGCSNSIGHESDSIDFKSSYSFNGNDSSKYVSPVPSPTPCKDQSRFAPVRKRENSYDIDNIVIPYCMAASTRPEKLNYKEILTPKWRLVKDEVTQIETTDLKNGVRRPSHDFEQGEEDASEEAAIARHDRCEIEERKKFLSYLKIGRSRGGRRVDSRAESSGPNTPDQALSPMELDQPPSPSSNNITAPTSSIPGQSSDSHHHTQPISELPPPPTTPSLQGPLTRKRTISLCSQPKSPCSTMEIAPYEPRIFPLSDEIYEAMVLEQKEFQEYPVDESLLFKNCETNEASGNIDPGSPSTDSVDSVLNTEDPNDPEWTEQSKN